MAARDVIDCEQELILDGHIIHYSVNWPNSSGTLLYHFDKSFTFYCNVSPTSWSFRITLRIMPLDVRLSCVATFRRTDESRTIMGAEFWIRMFPDLYPDLPTRSFSMRMPGGGEETRTFDQYIPYLVQRYLGNLDLLFQVSFGVHGCHEEDDVKRLVRRTENRGNKVLFNKM